MCLVKYQVLLFIALLLHMCYALNCRSNGGPKEEELRSIYKSCLKKQNGNNSSFSRNYGEDSWNDGYQRNQWDRDRDDEMNDRDDRMYGRESRTSNKYNRMENHENDENSRNNNDNNRRYNNDGYSRNNNNGGYRNNRNDRNGRDDRYSSNNRNNRDDGYNTEDRNNGYDRNNRDDGYNNNNRNYNDRTNNRDDKMGYWGNNHDEDNYRNERDDNRYGSRNNMGQNDNSMSGSSILRKSDWNRRDDLPMTDEFGSFAGQEVAYNAYRSTAQIPSRRFKREKQTNSGQRSQYNPNQSSKRKSSYDPSYRSDDKNSNENNASKDMDKKACALHCFLENMQMTGEDGMPDRYLVTHAITKDIKDEDLKDFLQESIEECFQILDNENSEDKCEFSKNLLVCLSEKGRANCDDWKDDFQF